MSEAIFTCEKCRCAVNHHDVMTHRRDDGSEHFYCPRCAAGLAEQMSVKADQGEAVTITQPEQGEAVTITQPEQGEDVPVATTPKERAVVQCWDVMVREELEFGEALQVCCALIGHIGRKAEVPHEARAYAIKKILEVLP